MQNEGESTKYVGIPVGVITFNVLCFGDMADSYFSEISTGILNILRQGNACQIIIEAQTMQETIAVSVGLQREVCESLSPVPALIESIEFKEHAAYLSSNPDGSESYKKIIVAIYAIDMTQALRNKQGFISRVVSRIRKALKKEVVPT
ncbi:MAG TPA: hypothetical protein P5096_01025 [Patescibacteria group bacterium]|nr:hypothetical protein [Patescibacteria group bacterium]